MLLRKTMSSPNRLDATRSIVILNLREPDTPPLTGPLARKDLETIYRHLKALENDPFKNVYEGFLEAFGLEEITIGDRK